MKELVIFDLDGTLLNTIEDLGYACNYALQQQGLPMHEISEYYKMVGNGIRNLIKRAAPAQSDYKIEEILQDFLQYYDKHCTDHTQPYPGITDMLTELKQRGFKLAVCSNKYQSAVDKIINFYFPDTFVSIYGEREGIPRKPDPTAINKIIEETGVSKDNTVMIGDSEVDLEAASRAGVDSIAVSWGFRSPELLRQYCTHPSPIISSPSELKL